MVCYVHSEDVAFLCNMHRHVKRVIVVSVKRVEQMASLPAYVIRNMLSAILSGKQIA